MMSQRDLKRLVEKGSAEVVPAALVNIDGQQFTVRLDNLAFLKMLMSVDVSLGRIAFALESLAGIPHPTTDQGEEVRTMAANETPKPAEPGEPGAPEPGNPEPPAPPAE